MLLRKAIDEINGLRFVVDDLELRSGLSKRVLLEAAFIPDGPAIEAELDQVERTIRGLDDETVGAALDNAAVKLERIKDIRGTVEKIKGGITLDDIGFFETKVFAINADAIREMLAGAGFPIVEIPVLGDVVGLLDPDRTGIPHFSVYDSYDEELAGVRRRIKKLKQKGVKTGEIDTLYAENARLEDRVREDLSARLKPFADTLAAAMHQVARLDILVAKASQARRLGLCRPQIAEGETRYRGLFNPMLRDVLRKEGKDFQSVDISVGEGPTVIMGANMGGKTVLLKSVALAQAMIQFGFYAPAAEAEVAAVDVVITAIGDEQNEMSGLSSFAAEMVRLDAMVAEVRAGRRPLVLIDEPARTTNPVEGEAIVNALVDFLAENRVRSLLTSHYGGIAAGCRRLRVRGFAEDVQPGEVTIRNIQDHMDYSLIPDQGDPPREALRIARILGVDGDLLGRAAQYMESNKKR